VAIEVLLPQWGMGMQEGTIVRWLKAQGDVIEEGEPLCEVETAKATDDLAAPGTGVLERIYVEEGTTVPVGELLAMIADTGDQANIPQR
jgi:pyruvate/2-oxoglutarate dehydrogenase complex dihydrolipoamide acyltransferase (E2) component